MEMLLGIPNDTKYNILIVLTSTRDKFVAHVKSLHDPC
jgi:hypothetical protein